MSAFKPFTTADVIVSPFKVNKSFSFEGLASLTGSGIDVFEGENTLPLAFNIASDSTGYIAPQGLQDQLQQDILLLKINF